MRRLILSTALLAAAAAMGACHNPKASKSDTANAPVGTAQIASNDVPNCKPVACTPSGGVGGSTSSHKASGEASASGASASGGGGSASPSGAVASNAGRGHSGAWRGYHRVHETGARRHWWNWGWGGHASRAKAPSRPASHPGNFGWRQAQAGTQGWTRQDHWNDRDRELNLAQLHGGWTRRDHYASGYGPDHRWRDDRSTSHGRQAHYGYLDEPLDRGAYDERYSRQHSVQGSSYTRYYGEHRVVAPARACAPGAWLSPDGRCVWAQHRAGQEVSVPGSFFYDNGGVGSDVSGGGGGGGGGFIYGGGGGYGRSSASAFASAHAYASAHASVHVRGGSHGGGHGGHGGGCGCGGKH